jgi:hypothetical protein
MACKAGEIIRIRLIIYIGIPPRLNNRVGSSHRMMTATV